MATYLNKSWLESAWNRVNPDWLVAPKETARTYANADVIKGPQIMRGIKICDAWVAHEELDTNATPTATGQLEVTDGTTTVALVTVTAALLGTTGGAVTRLNVPAGAGYVPQTAGFWIQFRFTAAVATAGSGTINFAVAVTNYDYPGEDPTGTS